MCVWISATRRHSVYGMCLPHLTSTLDRADKKGWKVCVLDVDVDTTTAAGRLVVDVVAAAAQF
jgi:DNA invertase Pin-like site-specific DNA recombinase